MQVSPHLQGAGLLALNVSLRLQSAGLLALEVSPRLQGAGSQAVPSVCWKPAGASRVLEAKQCLQSAVSQVAP